MNHGDCCAEGDPRRGEDRVLTFRAGDGKMLGLGENEAA